MGARIARLAARQPDRVLAGLAVSAVAAGLIVGVGESRLTLGGSGASATPLQIGVSGAEPVRSGSYQVALEVIGSRLDATPGVEAVRPGPISADGHSITLTVTLVDDPTRSADAVAALESELDAGQLRLSFSGGASRLREARAQALDDLSLLGLAAPLVALVLVVALGSRGALATLFAAAATVLGAAAFCIGLSLAFDVSVLSLVGTACAGVPSTVLLCRLLRHGASRSVLVGAALASAVAFGSLIGLGVSYLAWLGLGGMLASLLAAPVALAAMTAAGALWDLKPPARCFTERLFERLATTVGWNRPVAAATALLSTGALLVLALPVIRLDPVSLAAPAAPTISLQRILVVGGVAFLCLIAVLLLAGRRPLAALATALISLPAAAAGAGLCVVVFQDGRLREPLDFDPFGIGVGWLAAGVATVAAASAAQAAAALAMVRADASGSSPEGGERGYPRAAAAGVVASATAALAAAALLASSLDFTKGLGLLIAAGLVLDVVLVRGLIAAALLGARRPRARNGAASPG